jgi:MFS family permease
MTRTAPATSRRPLAGLAAAEIISTTGTEMTAIALPWFVLVSSESATKMGAVLAAEFVGMTVLGLWGGRVAGALGSRQMMLACDLTRAGLVALIPILYWVDALSFALLLVVGFLVGAFFPAYTASQRLVLAGIVGDDELRLTRVGGLLSSVNETASFVGPALGGVLVVLIGPENVLLVDAGSYLVAFLLVATLVPRLPAATSEEDGPGGVVEGLRYLGRARGLRGQVIGLGISQISWTAMVATLPVLALRDGGAWVAGWLLGSYGLGSIVGGLLSARAKRTGGHTAAWAMVAIAGSTWLLLLPVPVWALTLAIAVNGLGSGLFYPRFFSSLTTSTPPALRARVMTSVTIALAVPAPIGFLGAGYLSEHTGSTTASLLLVTTSATLGAAVTIRALRRAPQPALEPAEEGTSDAGPSLGSRP